MILKVLKRSNCIHLLQVFALLFAPAVCDAFERPVVRLSKPQFAPVDLGSTSIKKASNAIFKIALLNDTENEVVVSEIQMSCSCLGAKLEKGVLPVGESTELTLKLRAVTGGDQQASFKILNVSGVPLKSIPVKWTVTHSLELVPSSLDFGVISRSGTQPIKFQVYEIDNDGNRSPLDEFKLSTSHPNVLKAKAEGNRVTLALETVDRAIPGGYVYISSINTTEGKEISFPVSWQHTLPRIAVLPKTLRLSHDSDADTKVLFVAREGEVSEIQEISLDSIGVKDFKCHRLRNNQLRLSFAVPKEIFTERQGISELKVSFADGEVVRVTVHVR